MVFKSRLILVFALLASSIAHAKIEKWAEKNYKSLGKLIVSPVVRKKIQESNQKNSQLGSKLALSKIQKIDIEWRNSIGVTNLVQPYVSGTCPNLLRQAKNLKSYITEIMVLDDLGAIVCASNKTSDFWQGDEVKWQDAYANGVGANIVSKPAFDESTQTFSVHVSFPVREGEKVIGVIVVGVDLDEVNLGSYGK